MSQLEKLYQQFLKTPRISTDSRSDTSNSIFFALSGEHFNGNKFATSALEKGASIAVVDDASYVKNEKYFLVDNTLDTLQQLAGYHRKRFDIPVLAITGTNGKTTTKELISIVLSKKYNTCATKGNYNNHIGVPLTLLQINDHTEIAVIEIGANHIGEIAALCSVALPTSGIITNIGRAHIEGFGSCQGVITAKNELYQYLQSSGGDVIVNHEDNLLMTLAEGIDKFLYGENHSDVEGHIVSLQPGLVIEWTDKQATYICKSRLYGKYNLPNILAAIAAGIKYGVDLDEINEAIEAYVPENNRSQIQKTKLNTLYLDAYNANPVSMKEAIESFWEMKPENPYLILGDMFELGPVSKDEHMKIVSKLREKSFKNVLLAGRDFAGLTIEDPFLQFETTEKIVEWLKQNPVKGANILIKGSRGMRLEQVIEYL